MDDPAFAPAFGRRTRMVAQADRHSATILGNRHSCTASVEERQRTRPQVLQNAIAAPTKEQRALLRAEFSAPFLIKSELKNPLFAAHMDRWSGGRPRNRLSLANAVGVERAELLS